MTLSFAAAIPLEFRIHPRLNYDIDRDQGFDRPEAFPARFDDLYADFFSRWFELRAGYQVFSWKVVESYSQADILNQADREEDFFDPPKIGEPAVRARFILPSRTPNVLELYYLPRFTPSPLPGEESRYYFFQDDRIRLARDDEDYLYSSSDGRGVPNGPSAGRPRPSTPSTSPSTISTVTAAFRCSVPQRPERGMTARTWRSPISIPWCSRVASPSRGRWAIGCGRARPPTTASRRS